MARARLPMLLGLAVLTTGAHVLVAGGHLFGGHADWRDWPLLALLALAPVVAIVIALRENARIGAALLTLTMAAAGAWTLWSHYVATNDLPDPWLYAWLIHMTFAFELQGAALGAMLIVKPQVPRAAAQAA